MAVRAPVLLLIVYPETLLLFTFATYANCAFKGAGSSKKVRASVDRTAENCFFRKIVLTIETSLIRDFRLPFLPPGTKKYTPVGPLGPSLLEVNYAWYLGSLWQN